MLVLALFRARLVNSLKCLPISPSGSHRRSEYEGIDELNIEMYLKSTIPLILTSIIHVFHL